MKNEEWVCERDGCDEKLEWSSENEQNIKQLYT